MILYLDPCCRLTGQVGRLAGPRGSMESYGAPGPHRIPWGPIHLILNSIQNHPLWNALRSSFIAVLAADIFVMLYIWNRSKTVIKPPTQNVSRTSIKNTDDALNDYYRSIQKNVRKTSISSLKAKAAQERELETMKTRTLAATNIQQWWKRHKTAPKEFHTILTAAS